MARPLAAAVLLVGVLAGCAAPPPPAAPSRSGPQPPVATTADCGCDRRRTVVGDAAQLTAASPRHVPDR